MLVNRRARWGATVPTPTCSPGTPRWGCSFRTSPRSRGPHALRLESLGGARPPGVSTMPPRPIPFTGRGCRSLVRRRACDTGRVSSLATGQVTPSRDADNPASRWPRCRCRSPRRADPHRSRPHLNGPFGPPGRVRAMSEREFTTLLDCGARRPPRIRCRRCWGLYAVASDLLVLPAAFTKRTTGRRRAQPPRWERRWRSRQLRCWKSVLMPCVTFLAAVERPCWSGSLLQDDPSDALASPSGLILAPKGDHI